ncbi:sugar kinase [Falsihalocynthiibacter sp. S25ZX9]|uniref:sugar kinase n=1 Tax=Falsihalocynthiibacter sp. S25ZX9 TaxID=3240870 RepID=UPI0035106F15
MTQKNFMAIGEAMIELAVVGPDTYRRGFAGDTFNTAWYLAKTVPEAWKTSYFTGVGSDSASQEMRAFGAAANIDMSFARDVAGKTVGLYMIHLDNGERSFSYWRSDSAARQMAGDQNTLRTAFASADVLFFSGITMAVILPEHRDTFLSELAYARKAGKTIVYDPNQRLRLWTDQAEMVAVNTKAAQVSDIVLPSFDEEQLFNGDETPEATIARYQSLGVKTVVVKNGAASVIAQTLGGTPLTIAPNIIDNVVDSTAAGDSFNAGFCASYFTGGTLSDAIKAGASLAGQVVQAHGALVALTE